MIISEMTDKECRVVLTRATMGRLGCARENLPYIVPIYLAYEPDYFYVFATFGQKIEWMRANPNVCVEIDEITNETQWMSVIATGRYQELPEPRFTAERAHARELLQNRYQWWLNALAERRLHTTDNSIAPLYFRIHIDSITGLCARANGE